MALKASLDITTGLKNGKTILQDCYATPPFKVMNITEEKQFEELHLMIMNSSPGVLDGDQYDINIRLQSRNSLNLHSQSYQRLFEMKGRASQQVNVDIDDHAKLIYLPHPVVPHKNACFNAQNRIRMKSTSTLVWGEVLTPGRTGCGELFQFNRYQNNTRIFLDGKLVVRENMIVEPKQSDVGDLGNWEGYTHQASLIFIDSAADVHRCIMAALEFRSDDYELAASALPVNGVLVRLLGRKGEQLFQLLKDISSKMLESLENIQSIVQPKKQVLDVN